jgi:hypothetical protein
MDVSIILHGSIMGIGERLDDPPIAAVEPAEIKNLRYGLNAIARWLQ